MTYKTSNMINEFFDTYKTALIGFMVGITTFFNDVFFKPLFSISVFSYFENIYNFFIHHPEALDLIQKSSSLLLTWISLYFLIRKSKKDEKKG